MGEKTEDETYPMFENFRVVDLFCGCGGMSLGFQRLGFKVIAAFDNWHHAIDTYN